VHFVDDVDLGSRSAGPDVDVRTQLADLVDPTVAGSVDFQNVDIVASGDALALIALPAGSRSWSINAIQALGEYASRRCLSHTASTGEQVGVAHAFRGDGVSQSLGDLPLAYQLLERLGAISPSNDNILAASFSVVGTVIVAG